MTNRSCQASGSSAEAAGTTSSSTSRSLASVSEALGEELGEGLPLGLGVLVELDAGGVDSPGSDDADVHEASREAATAAAAASLHRPLRWRPPAGPAARA